MQLPTFSAFGSLAQGQTVTLCSSQPVYVRLQHTWGAGKPCVAAHMRTICVSSMAALQLLLHCDASQRCDGHDSGWPGR